MPRRGENIHKRKDGRWEGRYIDCRKSDGRAHYKSIYARSYTEVKAKLSKLKAVPIHRQVTSLVTLEQLCFLWLEDKKITVKESTHARYYQVICGHIVPYFVGVKTDRINNSMVNQFVKDKLQHGRLNKKGGLSAKSVNDILSILLSIVQYGEKKGYIVGFDYEVIRPKREYKELDVLSHQEQNRLLQHIKQDLDHKKLGVMLALYTGIRLGELCALTWGDIDFETGTLKITKTLQRIKDMKADSEKKTKMVIDSPKSQKSVREIPLPMFLLCALGNFRRENNVYILSNKLKYIEPRFYQNKFKQYLKQSELQPIPFHALRHTFATRAVEQQFDYKTLSEILGHSSVRFTLERYVHSSIDTKRASMERLAVGY